MSQTRGEVFLSLARDWGWTEDTQPNYHGRGYYEGPAATIPQDRLSEFLAMMPFPCKWDSMGKSSVIVYPKRPDSDARSALQEVWDFLEPEFDAVRFG